MASFRGVKFGFSETEKVLCFEPDPTKAKVLYEAKILEINVGRDKNGKRLPEYLVHFYGWNSSWDRIVREDHILKYSDENVELMRKLADVIKQVKKNKARKKRIDDILKKVLQNHEGLDEDDEDEEEGEEKESESEEDSEEDSTESQASDAGSDDLETVEESEEEDDEVKEVIIEIPDVLKKDLEHDFSMVTAKNKVARLPAKPNVITVLEGFVKNYAINALVGTAEKRTSYSPEHRIQLCKEVMDGLRIFFDFLLPTHLLYNEERVQYKKIISSYHHSSIDEHGDSISDTPVTSPRRRTRHSSAVEPNSKLPKLSPSAANSFEFPQPKEEEQEPVPRRITRHAAAEEGSKKQMEKKTGQDSKSVRHKVEPVAARATPPPPLLLPNTARTASSKASGYSTPVKSEQGLLLNENETIMNEVLSWRLVPEDVLLETAAQPSQIYGCHHLLRLFVKLPEFLSLMKIPDMKLRTLLRYMDSLLEYICDRRSDLMVQDAYVTSCDGAKHTGRR